MSGDELADFLEHIAERIRGVPEERIAAEMNWQNDYVEAGVRNGVLVHKLTGGYSYSIHIRVVPPGRKVLAPGREGDRFIEGPDEDLFPYISE